MHIEKPTSEINNKAYRYILKKNVKSLMPSYKLSNLSHFKKNDQNKFFCKIYQNA